MIGSLTKHLDLHKHCQFLCLDYKYNNKIKCTLTRGVKLGPETKQI